MGSCRAINTHTHTHIELEGLVFLFNFTTYVTICKCNLLYFCVLSFLACSGLHLLLCFLQNKKEKETHRPSTVKPFIKVKVLRMKKLPIYFKIQPGVDISGGGVMEDLPPSDKRNFSYCCTRFMRFLFLSVFIGYNTSRWWCGSCKTPWQFNLFSGAIVIVFSSLCVHRLCKLFWIFWRSQIFIIVDLYLFVSCSFSTLVYCIVSRTGIYAICIKNYLPITIYLDITIS